MAYSSRSCIPVQTEGHRATCAPLTHPLTPQQEDTAGSAAYHSKALAKLLHGALVALQS